MKIAGCIVLGIAALAAVAALVRRAATGGLLG